ncbi:AEC family transporter [Desulfonatronum thioautotrophicum]|uniref:AEC family transporter n=1 Tax=Desulfonatronum thioautotrophicum TaxID=617001 RepID=UPI0005EBC7C8|nr:AEC family transporter [Desulfonatronum thioautotrophicum]
MFQVVTALTPIFLLILLGWVFKQKDFPGTSFWPAAEKITYYVFFPALLFINTYRAPFADIEVLPITLAIVLTISIVTVLMLFVRPWLSLSGPAFSSLYQGSLRLNTYVGISAAFVLFGDQGLILSAMVIAVLVPLTNLFSVCIVSRYGINGFKGWTSLSSALLCNPLILACLLGIAANLLNVPLEFGLMEFMVIMSQASLGLGLMSVGAGLVFQGMMSSVWTVGVASTIKLAILPLLAALMGWMMGVDATSRYVIVIFASLPCGPAAYILARQLGGDHKLIAEIITIQTIAAFITMPVLLRFVHL